MQVPVVNTTCLAWLQQQMQMVGVTWHFTKHCFCLVVYHLLRAVQLAPNTADSAEWVVTKWDAAEHLPVIESFLSSLKVRIFILLKPSLCKFVKNLLGNHAGCSGLCMAGQAG